MACKCDVGLGNTGLVNCQPIATVAKKLIVVPTYKNDGTKNYVDLNTTLDQAYWDAAINNANADERFFPLPLMENITQERAESTYEESASGRKAFIREGVKSFAGEMWKQSPAFLGKLKEARCTDISVYVIDNDGNILGMRLNGDDTKLYPIRVDKESWNPTLVSATDSTIQKVNLGFDWHDDERDENIRMITEDEYDGDVLGLRGLLDVNVVYSNITTTGFTATLSTIYGSLASLVKDSGLVLADFSLYNNTTTSSVTITSVTESASGVYDFVIPAQTSADELVLTPSKAGRDYTNVIAEIILIP